MREGLATKGQNDAGETTYTATELYTRIVDIPTKVVAQRICTGRAEVAEVLDTGAPLPDATETVARVRFTVVPDPDYPWASAPDKVKEIFTWNNSALGENAQIRFVRNANGWYLP